MSTATHVFDWIDRIEALEVSRSFVLSILNEAYRSGNELQAEEFEAKLKDIDEEIKLLLQ